MIGAVSSFMAQQIVDTVKDVCGQDINFIQADGMICASTNPARIGTFHEIGRRAAREGCPIEVEEGGNFAGTQQGINMPVYHKGRLIAVIGITGIPHEVRKYAYLAERITILLIREQELNASSRRQADQKHYIVTALAQREQTDSSYLSECLKEYGIDFHSRKRFLILQFHSGSNLMNLSLEQQRIGQLFEQAGITLSAFRYPREFLGVIEDRDYEKISCLIREFTKKNSGLIYGAMGKPAELFQLYASYESALTALKSLEESGESFASFDDLRLELILSSADQEGKEEFTRKILTSLSEEDLQIMEAYFSEDMSLSNTCKRLYLHKNTLQYKLNRIHQKSGLNPRSFRDAVLLYLALRIRSF